jgi:diacylglycerol kinase family enzyme
MRRQFLIIHNPRAGLKNPSLLTKTLVALEEAGCEMVFEVGNDVEHDAQLAAMAAKEGRMDAVVAAGGDSTVRGVAKGLMGTQMPLGIIPVGTGNVLAHEIDLVRRPYPIASTLMDGLEMAVKPGLANGEPFLLMTGVGFDADVVKHLDHGIKQHIKKGAYVWPVLRALMKKPARLRVIFEDGGDESLEETAAFVVVSKIRYYGGPFVLAPDADLMADRFEVVLFTDRTRIGLIGALVGLARGWNMKTKQQLVDPQGQTIGRYVKSRGVLIRSCRKVRIESLSPVATQIDGEWLANTPLGVEAASETLKLITPAQSGS